MDLFFDTELACKYKSPSQKARVLTEHWVYQNIYCPNCGRNNINKYEDGKPVADFFCPKCKEDYELKSKKTNLGHKIVDGAYKAMITRLKDARNPNLFLLNYDVNDNKVLNFAVIPKHFFIPQIIEKRKPLAETARRAGWVGCNILINNIPQTGKIFYIKNKKIEPKDKILEDWQKTLFLREEKEISGKGWLLDIMSCIDVLGKQDFSLQEIYAFEATLSKKHPQNKHIKAKIRQQLQFLREKNYLKFMAKGKYKLA